MDHPKHSDFCFPVLGFIILDEYDIVWNYQLSKFGNANLSSYPADNLFSKGDR